MNIFASCFNETVRQTTNTYMYTYNFRSTCTKTALDIIQKLFSTIAWRTPARSEFRRRSVSWFVSYQKLSSVTFVMPRLKSRH